MIKCWHFLKEDRRLRWGTQEVVKKGKTYTCEGEIELCENGLHGSKRIIDALGYAPGPIICRVEIWGDVVQDYNKIAGRNRKVLEIIDGTWVLHWFATRIAEHALKRAKVKDKRCWKSIEVKRQWLDGKATDDELAAARAAARDAAWAAARDAAGAAARDAAWAAARDAARDAARAAAGDAARAAAGDAARAAARDIQSRYLQGLVMAKIQEKNNGSSEK